MFITNHAMTNILKQQEIEIEEVIDTIHENINHQRSDLRFCLPELKKVLIDLLQEHCSDTKHLATELGVDHPMVRVWEHRDDQLVDWANEALYLTGITLRNYEEWDLDETEEIDSAHAKPAKDI